MSKYILLRKTQQADYTEEIQDIVTINRNTRDEEEKQVLTQISFPYRIYYMFLPQYRHRYVYIHLSIRNQEYAYFGQPNRLQSRIQSQNSRYGATGIKHQI